MVYFAQPVDGGPIKIGCSENVSARIRRLESDYGRPLVVLRTMPGGRQVEAELHGRFAAYRLGRTEQFRPAAEILEFIQRPLLVGANPDAVEVMGEPSARKPTVAQLKGSAAWKGWVEDIAAKEGFTVAMLFERALRAFGKANGYPDPPKR